MLLHADARWIPVADQSVQCVVTSPPYFSLRDYHLPPGAPWGGDPACRHSWRNHVVTAERGRSHWQQANNGRALRSGKTIGRFAGSVFAAKTIEFIPVRSRRAFCRKCGAWRGTLGLEPTIDLYVAHLVEVFREVRRVLHPSGTLWLNLGDSYASGKGSRRSAGATQKKEKYLKDAGAFPLDRGNLSLLRASGVKPKDLLMVPARAALALQADGWYLRSQIVWEKPNAKPESAEDRPTLSYELVYLLTKRARYFFDMDAVKEPHSFNRWGGPKYSGSRKYHPDGNGGWGRVGNTSALRAGGDQFPEGGRHLRSVWRIPVGTHSDWMCLHCSAISNPRPLDNLCPKCGKNLWQSHFAAFPEKLVEPCILAGTRAGDLVLDPFGGTATVGRVAERFNRRWVSMDLNYHGLAAHRTRRVQKELLLA